MIVKLITKTIANRLKQFLPLIIHHIRNAFVLDKLIIDNTLMAFELFHHIKKKVKGKKGVHALKLDISKVYDMVCHKK